MEKRSDSCFEASKPASPVQKLKLQESKCINACKIVSNATHVNDLLYCLHIIRKCPMGMKFIM